MKMQNNNSYPVNITHIKIMMTISLLNKEQLYPNVRGVEEILNGNNDKYDYLDTYMTLVSVKGRKLCSMITNLIRHKYLTYIYDDNSDDMYLKITDFGQSFLDNYLSKPQIKLADLILFILRANNYLLFFLR